MMPNDSGYHLSLTYVYISVLYINHVIEVDLRKPGNLWACSSISSTGIQKRLYLVRLSSTQWDKKIICLQASAFSGGEGGVPLMPNVLKVFLENGQTKSFKYDSTTRVGDVVSSLQQKLCLKSIHHFALVLEQVKSLRRNKLTLLNPDHTLARVWWNTTWMIILTG